LLVDVEDEQWIAYVGFGGQKLTAPLRLQAEIDQQTPNGEYRLMQEGSTWILKFRHHEHWQSMYCFDLGVKQQSDHVMGNF
ncbi:arylamine N-acetyltransferase, partial [Salmonella enterica]|uniref:arylamine N-acetyltransferase n=1 Tax=Salmonella enterica TaxID=28901 RepID=UPI001F30FCE4